MCAVPANIKNSVLLECISHALSCLLLNVICVSNKCGKDDCTSDFDSSTSLQLRIASSNLEDSPNPFVLLFSKSVIAWNTVAFWAICGFLRSALAELFNNMF